MKRFSDFTAFGESVFLDSKGANKSSYSACVFGIILSSAKAKSKPA